AGALVGLVFALIGVGMATLTGDARWDGLGAMAVGTLLVVIAVFLAFEMSSMLVGESALPEQDAAIRQALEATDEVDRVIHLKTLHVGPDELLVAAKIAIGGEDDATTIARGIDTAEAAVRAVVPTARYIYLEPDLDRSVSPPPVDCRPSAGRLEGVSPPVVAPAPVLAPYPGATDAAITAWWQGVRLKRPG